MYYTVKIRTPDDEPPDWTAEAEYPVGINYVYFSGDVAVVVNFWEDNEGPNPSEDKQDE